jgi:hypothetical protein
MLDHDDIKIVPSSVDATVSVRLSMVRWFHNLGWNL